ncbi:MAG: hypothetical protein IJI16_03500, partial [Atopobiaceae bacterium]|nr:hypothetical protein [Atopobiaceae bacterium]
EEPANDKAVNKVFDTATSSAQEAEKKPESSTPDPSNPEPSTDPNANEGPKEAVGSEVHAVGAVAITVILNTADAHIDSTGLIVSAGNFVLDASATTMATTISDATAITKAEGSKTNTTIENDTTTITTKPESLDKLQSGLEVEVTHGTYTSANCDIIIRNEVNPTGEPKIINVGGEAKADEKNNKVFVISGGTTTFTGIDIVLDPRAQAAITWTGNAENPNDTITIQNSGKTITEDGLETTTYDGGTVTIQGGTLVVKGGRMYLYNATLTYKGGTVYLGPTKDASGKEVPMSLHVVPDTEAGTTTITGSFAITNSVGGDVTITANKGAMRLSGYNGGTTAKSAVATARTRSRSRARAAPPPSASSTRSRAAAAQSPPRARTSTT